MVVTTPGTVVDLGERIRNRLEQSLDYFYPLKDRDEVPKFKKKLGLKMSGLMANQGPFTDLSQLKTSLFRQKS